MQRLSTDAILKKLTKVTLGMGIFLLGILFVALPIPGSATLGELLMLAGIIEFGLGTLSLGREKAKYRVIYLVTGVFALIFSIVFIYEYILLLLYVGFGYDISVFISQDFNAPQLGISLLNILFIFSYIEILLLMLSVYFLGNDQGESKLSKDAFFLITVLAFLAFLQLTQSAIISVDGYLRPLLIYVLYYISNTNYLNLVIALILLAASLYSIVRVYLSIGKLIQREYKKKFNLPY
ncbi:MAG TPA: hypothetical protein VKU94_01555 [Geobacterales bacterium]|nr:hypothetical protein [Geobacterales bacterium]